jgi:catechol 2,3-dioxygenase-like lactoylglutathione lyase family enzyme
MSSNGILAGFFKMALYYSSLATYALNMLSKGITTIFVTDMDRSIRFYTETLGLRLAQRFGNHWGQVEAGQLVIGLHPESAQSPAGRNGSITIGLTFSTPIEQAVSMLQQKGVKFQGPITQDNAGKIAYFEDPDGNLLYLWETAVWAQHSASGAGQYQTTR